MCVDCEEEGITRRSFLTGATTAIAGAVFALNAAAQQSAQKTLNDPNIILDEVGFKSGTNTIKGLLARPKKAGRYRMVLIAHGNPGVPEDIKFTAAELAKAGYVSLVYDWGSREPQPADPRGRDNWVARITSYTFVKLQMQDLQAGMKYLREQSFTKRERVGVVGFCAGGRLAFLFSMQSADVKALISFYGPVVYHINNPKADPVPNVLEIVNESKFPCRGITGCWTRLLWPKTPSFLRKSCERRKHQLKCITTKERGIHFATSFGRKVQTPASIMSLKPPPSRTVA